MGILSKVYLALPATPVELLSNEDFELQTGDDFDDWTETIPAFAELLTNKDFELVAGNDFTDWTEFTPPNCTVEDEQVEVHGDVHSVKMVNGSVTGTEPEIYQSETVTIGQTYTLGAWVKGDWALFLSDGFPNFTKESGTAADWEYQTVTRTATTTTLLAGGAAPSNGDTCYMDDASLWLTRGNIELTATAHGGSDAVLITGAWTNTQPYIKQEVVSDPLDYHRFSFWSKGDGTNGVAYEIYDVTNGAVIVSGSGTTEATYTETVDQYYVPASCVLLRVTFTGVGSSVLYLDDASVLEYGADVWTLNPDVLAVPSPTWEYGMPGKDPLARLANTGVANLTFENDEGKYSPEHVARVTGFEEGMGIRIITEAPGGIPTIWDKEVDAVADFDAETDADNDLNDHADAAHDGAVGLEYTFDDANVMFGTMNGAAVNLVRGVISFWFDKNDIAIEVAAGKTVSLIQALPGAGAFTYNMYLHNNGKLNFQYRNDAGSAIAAGNFIAGDGYKEYQMIWERSTGPGNDDGYLQVYQDSVLVLDSTGHDNDTKDWDTVNVGMLLTNSGTFGGSFYMDTIKLSQFVGQTKFVGHMTNIKPSSGEFDNPVTNVVAQDWIGYLNKQELGIQAIQSDKRADEALTTALAEFPVQPESTDFDTGVETFELIFAGDSADSSMARFMAKLARNEQGRIFSLGDGTLRFEKQGTRDGSQASAFTLDGTLSEIDVSYSTNNIYNIVALDVKTQITDAAATTELFKVGQGIKFLANQKMTLECNFTDPDTGQRVAGSDVVTPVAAPHFGTTRTPANDDSHGDLTDDNYQVGGASLTVDLENTAGAVRYLNEFTILGKRITDYDRITVTKTNAASILQVGNKRYVNRLDLIEDPTRAENICDDILENYAPSHTDTCKITVLANIDSTLASQLITAEVSTKFTAIETITGINKDFYIDKIRYRQDYTLLWVTIEAEEA